MDFRSHAVISPVGVTTDNGETASIQTRPKTSTRLIRYGAVFVVATILATVALTFGVFRAFAEEYRTPMHATVFGVEISGLTTEQLHQKLISLKERQLAVKLPDNQLASFRLADMGLQFNPEETAQLASDPEAGLWEGDALAPRVWVNPASLRAFTQKALANAAEPISAALVRNGDVIAVQPSVAGWGVSSDSLVAQLTESLRTNTPLVLTGEAVEPVITTSSAERVRGGAQSFANSRIEITIEDSIETIQTIDVMQLASDQMSRSIEYGFDGQLLQERLQSIADSHSSKPWNELYSVTNGQKTILRAGRNGATVQGVDNALQQLINSGVGGETRSVSLQKSPLAFTSLDWAQSDTWIDVDLTAYQMTLWEAGQAQAVFPISGGKQSTPTPLGDYKITSKVRKMTMSGPGYSTPNIEYVSWFKFNYAIHSAYWHDKFGQENVSHGCVNARTDDARYVYEWAPVGTKVSVHY